MNGPLIAVRAGVTAQWLERTSKGSPRYVLRVTGIDDATKPFYVTLTEGEWARLVEARKEQP